MSRLFQIVDGKVSVEPNTFFSMLIHSEKNYQIIYNQNGLTWDQARIDAENRGGRLAIVKNYSEWLLMYNLIKNSGINIDSFWIGGFRELDIQQNEVWKWIDGSIMNFSRWNIYEPNDFFGKNSENCLEVLSNGLWNDYPCERPDNYGYIMETN